MGFFMFLLYTIQNFKILTHQSWVLLLSKSIRRDRGWRNKTFHFVLKRGIGAGSQIEILLQIFILFSIALYLPTLDSLTYQLLVLKYGTECCSIYYMLTVGLLTQIYLQPCALHILNTYFKYRFVFFYITKRFERESKK